MGCGRLGGALRCCLEMTGGSFAKISRKMAKKSRIFDFCGRVSAPIIIKATSKTPKENRLLFQTESKTHIPKLCPAH